MFINKSKIVLLIISIVSILGICFWILTSDNIKKTEKLPNVPNSATWIGGSDGGFWFDIINIDKENKVYRFKIYDDNEGNLVIDANFKKDSSCTIKYPLDKSILDKVSYFNFNEIGMLENCSLNMIEPAYGGTLLDVD